MAAPIAAPPCLDLMMTVHSNSSAKQVSHMITCLMHPDSQIDCNCFAVHVVDNFLQVLPALQCTLMLRRQHDVRGHDRVLDAWYDVRAFNTSDIHR